MDAYAYYYLTKRKLHDLKFSRTFVWSVSSLLLVCYYFARLGKVVSYFDRLSLKILMLARKINVEWPALDNILRNRMDDVLDHVIATNTSSRVKAIPPAHLYTRVLTLKNPIRTDNKTLEKGVLVIHFTENFSYFRDRVDINTLCRDYYVVLEPSWANYCDEVILFWCKYSAHKIIIEATERTDYRLIKTLDTNLIPVDFGASDFVDYNVFYPIENMEKIYDAVYVAVYGIYKRHHILFRAIRDIKDPSYRVALIGVPWRGSRREIEKIIDYYAVRDRVDIFENVGPDKVNVILNKSKVNILLSLKEGSNRAIFEGFFANTPAIVLKSNIGVNKSYINEQTGRLIREDELPEALVEFRSSFSRYSPRKWAMQNISPERSTEKLERIIMALSERDRLKYSIKMSVKVNRPEPDYLIGGEGNGKMSGADIIKEYSVR